MSPGTYVKVRQEWVHCYRKPGAEFRGVVVATSPSGAVARVHMDDLGDSYFRTMDLELVGSSDAAPLAVLAR